MSAASDGIRRRRRPAELRRMLIVVGRRLFAEQGYQATTQREIAARAGVSTSVLFRNFGSKSQLLVEAVIEPFGEFTGAVGSSVGVAGGADDRGLAREFVVDLIARLRPHRETLRSLLTALHTPDGDALMSAMGARLDQLVAELAEVLSRHDRAADRAADDAVELDVRLIVGMVTMMVVLDEWLLPAGRDADDERVVDMLTSMVGFVPGRERTRPGREGLRAAGTGSGQVPVNDSENGTGDEGSGRGGDQPRRSSDEVRAALLASASRLFAEHGYSGTGYREIALAAGTSESVLYRHFGSKDNLLAEAVLQPFTDSFEAASRDWARIDTETRRARQPEVIGRLYSMFVANRHIVRVLMGLAHDPKHQELNRLIAAWFARSFATLGALSRERARAEHITPYEPELRIRAVVAMVMAAAALDDWFLTRDGQVLAAAPVVGAISALIDLGRRDRAAGGDRGPTDSKES